MALQMIIAQSFDNLWTDQRRVTGENKNVIVFRESVAAAHDGVPGTALLFLQDELSARVTHGLAHTIGFVADDGIDVLGWNHFRGGFDHVAKKRLAAYFVQDFGILRLQPRTFSGGHDGDRK